MQPSLMVYLLMPSIVTLNGIMIFFFGLIRASLKSANPKLRGYGRVTERN